MRAAHCLARQINSACPNGSLSPSDGDPHVVRDYVYVDDVVEAMARVHRTWESEQTGRLSIP
ncbi:NAD-dependent epimerase/dehydratase family protein [Micromonospora rubida]